MAPVQSKPVLLHTPKPRNKGKARAPPEELDDVPAFDDKSEQEVVPTPRPTKRGGRQPGALAYSEAEVIGLLELISGIVPHGMKGWERVAKQHDEIWQKGWTWTSLKQKYERVSLYVQLLLLKCSRVFVAP